MRSSLAGGFVWPSALSAGSGFGVATEALAGSLVDAIVTPYFGKDRYKYTPSKRTPTSDAYDEFTIREFVAFAPMW